MRLVFAFLVIFSFSLMSQTNIVGGENANIEDQFSSFYIRLNVLDKKGVLAEITSLFKDNNVSIETMIQNPDNFSRENDSIPLLIVTHETYLKNINNLINKIANLDNVLDKPFVIQIYKV